MARSKTEKFKSPVPLPTKFERELTIILIEECVEVQKELADVIQRATKALRFGFSEVQPMQPDDNAKRLGHELGEVLFLVKKMQDEKLIFDKDLKAGYESKEAKLKKYMQSRKR